MTTISVITATFDCAATVGDCMASVAAQAYPDIDRVVVDGASRDGTVAAIAPWRSRIHSFVSEPDRGIYDALNKGIGLSRGEVVGFLHADDLFEDPAVLADVAAAFADPSVDVLYGDLVYVAPDDPRHIIRYWHSGEFDRRRLRTGWMPPHPTVYLRRSLYDRFGLFDTSFRIAADYDLMLRILSARIGRVVYLPRVMVRMRTGGASNRSLGNLIRKSSEDARALRTNGIGGWPTVGLKMAQKLGQFVTRPRQPE